MPSPSTPCRRPSVQAARLQPAGRFVSDKYARELAKVGLASDLGRITNLLDNDVAGVAFNHDFEREIFVTGYDHEPDS